MNGRVTDMNGRRVTPNEDKYNYDFEPGDYGKDSHGLWFVMTPSGHLGNLGVHQVTEHDDGTITVSPSILVNAPADDAWHGYLERGVWREV